MNRCCPDSIKPYDILKECVPKNIIKDPIYENKMYDVDETYVFKIKARIKSKEKELVVKVIKYNFEKRDEYEEYKQFLAEEAKYCVDMDKLKIGPKIYGTFYVVNRL